MPQVSRLRPGILLVVSDGETRTSIGKTNEGYPASREKGSGLLPLSSPNALVPPPTGRPEKVSRHRTKSPPSVAGEWRLTSPHPHLSIRTRTPQCTSDISAAEPAVRLSRHIRSYHATNDVVAAGPSGPCSSSLSPLRKLGSPRYTKRKPTSGHCSIPWRTFHTPGTS